jgi:hypothetical protein
VTTPVPIGNDIRVNTHTTDFQQSATVAALADGGFVITWASSLQDGSGYGIYGQRYAANGSAVGGEFKVNTETSDDQNYPSVAALADGGFVVTWSSFGQDGSAEGVYGQRYAADGLATGGEFKVNTETLDDQAFSSVAPLAGGGFVVTWTSSGQDGSGSGIYSQRYAANGSAAGGEFKVNAETLNDQYGSSVAALADGGFVVTWTSYGEDGSAEGVYGQRYSANGSAAGGEFRINTSTQDSQFVASVAALDGGGFVVTWSSNGRDGASYDIYGQRYAADGSPAGGEFQVNTRTANDQFSSSVAALADGGFVISWSSLGQDGDSSGMYGQRYAADGTPVGSEFRINQITTGAQTTQTTSDGYTIAALADGRLVQVWAGFGPEEAFYRLIDVPALVSGPTIDSIGAGGAIGGADSIVSGQSGDATVVGTADADATIHVKFGSTELGTATADKSGNWTYTLTTTNLALIGQGADKTITATQSAPEGGVEKTTTSLKFSVDTVAPAPTLSINAITADNVVNAAEAASTVQVSGTVSGEFKAGDTVMLTVNSAVSTGQVDAGGAFTISVKGSDLKADADHSVDGSITTTDTAGNTGSATAVKAYGVDTATPTPTPIGNDIQVNTYTTGIQRYASVAALAEGGFVVTWTSDGQDGSSSGIYGQRYAADGSAVGSEFKVNTYTTSAQTYSAVAALDGGGFVVTWSSNGQDGSSFGVYGQRYAADGSAAGSEFRINTHAASGQDYSSIGAVRIRWPVS